MAREEQVTPWNLCPHCKIPYDPNNPDARTMRTCCGRMICRECQLVIGPRPCPYCSEPAAKNVEEIHARLLRLENRQIPEAYYYVAQCYKFGDFGFEKSEETYAKWMTRAAQCGHLDAMVIVGNEGNGVKGEEERIRVWQLAAAQGHAGALCELGKSAKDRKDFAEAKQFFTRAAAQGHANGEFQLACCLTIDRNSCSDLDEKSRLSEEVWRLLGRAAAHGHPDACHMLEKWRTREAFFERHERELKAAIDELRLRA